MLGKLIKGGQLVEIEPEKVSLVKSPANKRRFIFTKAADLEITISTDQTFDGTKLTINGEAVENLDGFYFSLNNWDDKEIEEWGAIPFSASWSSRQSSEDGIESVETYSLQTEVKKTMEKSEILKAIKDNLAIELDEAGFDKLPIDKQKAMESLAVFSPAMNGQPAFRDGVAHFVKSDIADEETPAETPVTTTEPRAGDRKSDSDKRLEALEAGMAAINEKLDEKPDESGDENASEPVTKADLEAIAGKVDAIAKAAGVKDSNETDIAKSGGGEDGSGYPTLVDYLES